MGFVDELRQLAEQVSRRIGNVKSEEATKQALVVPFFQVLGYDVFDPTEVQPEYVADFAKKKSGGTFEKVDYAIHLAGSPALLVECKAVGCVPEDADGQLARYFNATTTVKVGIVTNGTKYRFFTDLQAPNIMDTAPFFVFDLTAFTDREAESLRSFTKSSFNATAVQSYAEEIIYTQRIMALVDRTLRDPPEAFVRYLLNEIDLVSGRLTAKVVERFHPIVRKAIHSTIVDMMTRSITQEINAEPSAPSVASAPSAAANVPAAVLATGMTSATDSSPVEGSRAVVTTAEELDLFEAIKTICLDSGLKAPIAFKDTTAYFAINLGKVTRWFVRAFFNGPRKSLVFRVALEKVQIASRGFECEAAPDNVGKSRVFISSVSDVEKLRPLILLAFEEEVQRNEPEGD
ncbi:MAG: type I restriction endonuclease [Deltaproteobacteria bacterium]|nr:type I restriction endonuclease [Deltaproteobacteria bacterium]